MFGSALANFFIKRSKEENIPITNMKLQKLMFIGYGWVLALTENDLTDGEGFMAWPNGPVLLPVYHHLKIYGGNAIESYVKDYSDVDNEVIISMINSDECANVLSKVWDVYKEFSASALKALTQMENTPWVIACNGNPAHLNIVIDPKTVSEYYLNYVADLVGEQ